MSMNEEQKQTLTINNFRGRLTNDVYGDINSGLTPQIASYGGANPFWSSYRNTGITFLEDKVSIGGSVVDDPILWMSNHIESVSGSIIGYVYGVGLNGHVFQIQGNDAPNAAVPSPDKDTPVKFTNSVGASAQTLNYGGGMVFSKVDGSTERIFVGHDNGVSYSSSFTPGSATWTDLTGGSWVTNVPRPMVEFLGNIVVGNGNNIATIDSTKTVVNYAKLSPALPPNFTIRDLDVSDDGRYLIITATQQSPYSIASTIPPSYFPLNSAIVLWNGSDPGYTSLKILDGVNVTSLAVSGNSQVLIGQDDEGVGIFDGNGTRVNQVFDFNNSTGCNAPTASSIYSIGTKFFFLAQQGTVVYLYCFDSSDSSLYALWSVGLVSFPIIGGVIIPSLHTQNSTGNDITRLKLYIAGSKTPVATQSNNLLYRIHLQNYGGSVFSGNYSSQVQVFGKKVGIDEVRVHHTNPGTSTNAAYTINLIGGNGGVYSGGALTYSYSAGTDLTLGQGSLNMIRFTPNMKPVSELGVNINNTGTGEIVISKIEIDYHFVDNPENQ